MNNLKKTFLASALMLATASAVASDFKYTYGEIGYGELDDNGDALYFGGAVDIQQGFGLIGSFYAADFDDDADGTIFTIGGQFHTPINNKADFVGSVQLINADVEWDCGWDECSEDDTGLLLRGGIRYAIQQNLQLEGDLSYITNDFWEDDELGIKAGLRFFLDRQVSIAGGIASDQELDGLFISGRYDFN